MRVMKSIEESLKKKTPQKSKTVIRKTSTNQYNECFTLISIMSAQLLICKFAVFTCVSCFFYRCLACWLAVCQDPFDSVERLVVLFIHPFVRSYIYLVIFAIFWTNGTIKSFKSMRTIRGRPPRFCP